MSTLTRVATRCEASCGGQVSSACGWPDVGRHGDSQGVEQVSVETAMGSQRASHLGKA